MGWFDERFIENPNKFKFNCIICNKEMWFPKTKHGKYLTCGKDCADKKNNAKKIARKRNCETCNKEFYPRLFQIKNNAGKFCSQKCNKASHIAMNEEKAQKKAKIAWKKRHELMPIIKKGEENPNWKGGKKATYERRKNIGILRTYYHNRRNKGGFKKMPADVVEELGNLQKWKCGICNCNIKNNYNIDHIIPIASGGGNEKTNLQLTCKKCNSQKGAKDPIDFMQSKGFLI